MSKAVKNLRKSLDKMKQGKSPLTAKEKAAVPKAKAAPAKPSKLSEFEQAFSKNRKAGRSAFDFKGKSYTTKLKK